MDIRAANNGLLESLLAPRFLGNENSRTNTTPEQNQRRINLGPQDQVGLSVDAITRNFAQGNSAGQTRLLQETITREERGFQRFQEFQRGDGSRFSRTEEFSATDNRLTRRVIQQNPSGLSTIFEDIFQQNGNNEFQRIQRFTDESGQTSVNISEEAFQLGAIREQFENFSDNQQSRFQPRGTRVDFSA